MTGDAETWAHTHGLECGPDGIILASPTYFDEEGVRTMKALGENMAWLLEKPHA